MHPGGDPGNPMLDQGRGGLNGSLPQMMGNTGGSPMMGGMHGGPGSPMMGPNGQRMSPNQIMQIQAYREMIMAQGGGPGGRGQMCDFPPRHVMGGPGGDSMMNQGEMARAAAMSRSMLMEGGMHPDAMMRGPGGMVMCGPDGMQGPPRGMGGEPGHFAMRGEGPGNDPRMFNGPSMQSEMAMLSMMSARGGEPMRPGGDGGRGGLLLRGGGGVGGARLEPPQQQPVASERPKAKSRAKNKQQDEAKLRADAARICGTNGGGGLGAMGNIDQSGGNRSDMLMMSGRGGGDMISVGPNGERIMMRHDPNGGMMISPRGNSITQEMLMMQQQQQQQLRMGGSGNGITQEMMMLQQQQRMGAGIGDGITQEMLMMQQQQRMGGGGGMDGGGGGEMFGFPPGGRRGIPQESLDMYLPGIRMGGSPSMDDVGGPRQPGAEYPAQFQQFQQQLYGQTRSPQMSPAMQAMRNAMGQSDMMGRPLDGMGRASELMGRPSDMMGRPSPEMMGRLSEMMARPSDMMGRPIDNMGRMMDMMDIRRPMDGMMLRQMDAMGRPVDNMGRPMDNISRLSDGMGRPIDSMGRPIDGMGRPMDGMGRPIDGMGRLVDGMGRQMDVMNRTMNGASRPAAASGRPMDDMMARAVDSMGRPMDNLCVDNNGRPMDMMAARSYEMMTNGHNFGPSPPQMGPNGM